MISLRNAVWQVTDSGLEAVNEDGERYRIARDALLKIDQNAFSRLYRCHTVVAGAPDAEVEGFLDVWPKAVEQHFGGLDGIDRRILQESIREARSIADRVRRARSDEIELARADLPEPDSAPSYPEADPPSYPSVEAPEYPSGTAEPPIAGRRC
jgi:hypothetical protein